MYAFKQVYIVLLISKVKFCDYDFRNVITVGKRRKGSEKLLRQPVTMTTAGGGAVQQQQQWATARRPLNTRVSLGWAVAGWVGDGRDGTGKVPVTKRWC